MSSKLDYLSKYLEDSPDKKNRKDKKKKKKASKRKEEVARLIVKDEDDDVILGHSAETAVAATKDDDDDSEREDDDEGPVVVNEDVLLHTNSSISRGRWEDVSESNIGHTSKRRYDSSSSDDDDDRRPSAKSADMGSNSTRKRYDSSDDDNNHDTQISKQNQRERYDSSYDQQGKSKLHRAPEQQQRHDSSSEDNDSSNDKQRAPSSKTRRRYDSDDSDDKDSTVKGIKEKTRPIETDSSSLIKPMKREDSRKRRYDSSSDDDHDGDGDIDRGLKVKAKHNSDSVSGQDNKEEKSRMSSGHRAGLQTGHGFATAEADIQRKRDTQAQDMVDRYGMGETVHRKKEITTTNKKPTLTAAQQAKINQGKYQKEKAARERQQYEQIQQSGFARRVDDDEIEILRKQSLRDGDPMAKYVMRHNQKTKGASNQKATPSRPVYKGPPPKPNRFGIRPGFRWDGNDRGNAFEDRLLAKRSSQSHRQEEAYRWSSAGM